MDHVEVNVVTLPLERWIRDYYRPAEFADACRMCPNFGKVWSCPILPNPVPQMLQPFSRVHLIGVKVVYKKETIEKTDTAAKADAVRVRTYDKVKRILLESMLELEKEIPGSWSIAAGECKICKKCARQDGLPCRHPDKMRFSFSGFGFDLVRIAHDLFGYELLWNPNGLPEYTVAFGALLDRENLEFRQQYRVELQKPWALLQEELLGVLQQLGCGVDSSGEQNLEKVYFDTPDGSVKQENSCLSLEQDGRTLSLVWKGRGETDQPGLFRPRSDSMHPAESRPGDTAAFIRRHLQYASLLPSVSEESLERRVELTDRAAGGGYRLIFRSTRYRDMPEGKEGWRYSLELVSTSGSGRRIRQLGGCLCSRFPELLPAESLC